ncbi:MAG: hypothetical protein U5K38_04075 [Woeseiaceae bacterium]|nr:hypothetical protein [Woeseiaceae bacterium]
MSTGHAIMLLEIGRRQKLIVDDLLAYSGRILRDGCNGPLTYRRACLFGPPAFEAIRDIHDMRGEHMLAGRRQRRIMEARHDDLHDRVGRNTAVFCIIEGKFDRIHVRRHDQSAVSLPESRKFRGTVKREVQFANIAVAAQPADPVRKADIE